MIKNSVGMKEILDNLEKTKNFANSFISGLKPQENRATVIGLYGELGVGKTNFTQAVAETLGVEDAVVSPTFVIMKVYELSNFKFEILNFKFTHLIHIDAYRLEESSELLHLGWKSMIENPENLVLIEWPERVEDIMPEHIKIKFEHISEDERSVQIL